MCGGSSRPSIPPLPPQRAMERLPARGNIAPQARRQIAAQMGASTRERVPTVLGAHSAQARRRVTGMPAAARGTSANMMGTVTPILGG